MSFTQLVISQVLSFLATNLSLGKNYGAKPGRGFYMPALSSSTRIHTSYLKVWRI